MLGLGCVVRCHREYSRDISLIQAYYREGLGMIDADSLPTITQHNFTLNLHVTAVRNSRYSATSGHSSEGENSVLSLGIGTLTHGGSTEGEY